MLKDRRGVALLYLIVFFTLLGVLVSVGVKKIGSVIAAGKINETKTGLENYAAVLFEWSLNKGRLPVKDEYAAVFGGTPMDAWGKPLVFSFYSTLTHKGGICGKTGMSTVYNGQPVAVVISSGGDDYSVDQTFNLDISPSPTILNPAPNDLVRVVTLEELKIKSGCYGSGQGRLAILNNELPAACKRQPYSAAIYADGGVAPYMKYSTSGLPAGLGISGANIIFGTSTTASGSYTVGVAVTDSSSSRSFRKYIFKLMTSCTP